MKKSDITEILLDKRERMIVENKIINILSKLKILYDCIYQEKLRNY
jgi:hypothetical protein